MEKGMAIIEVTDKATTGFFIDEEQLEFARQNAYTKKRREERAKAEKEARRSRRKDEKAAARRKAYTMHTVRDVLFRCGVAGAVAYAGTANLVHPFICIPVVVFCLCTACLRFGVWFGREGKR